MTVPRGNGRRLNGAGSLRCSGLAEAPAPRPKSRNYGCKCGRTSRSSLVAGNGIFGCRNRTPKISTKTGDHPQRQNPGIEWPDPLQKRPIWRPTGKARFARAGWWCAQSGANRSPLNISLFSGNLTGKVRDFWTLKAFSHRRSRCAAAVFHQIP
jgi:hypothetical protein